MIKLVEISDEVAAESAAYFSTFTDGRAVLHVAYDCCEDCVDYTDPEHAHRPGCPYVEALATLPASAELARYSYDEAGREVQVYEWAAA